jgi:DNA-binding CsgD family transcriptional regulator
MLGRHYKLTTAEVAVLLALLAGQRAEDVARLRRVKLCTVRTQVASLHAKLGLSRMDDVMRLVSGLPPMTGALRSPPMRSHGPAPLAAHAPATAWSIQVS